MGLLADFRTKYRVISVIGMAKNAGKTTALNYLIEEAMDEDVLPGVTSTGRDGENEDVVTGTEKPGVYLAEETIVTIPEALYDMSDAGLEILRMTEYGTALGQILLCRVVEGGYVQVSGPNSTADQKAICREMQELGAELILIDGAIDRRSIAAPDASDAVILSTGAVLSRSIRRVVEETMHVVDLYRLPVLTDTAAAAAIREADNGAGLLLLGKDSVQKPEFLTGLSAGRFLDGLIEEETRFVYLPGALTAGIVAGINPEKYENLTFVVKDPTKIFLDRTTWRQLCKKGLKVRVCRNIEIAAITVNPWSPEGYTFERQALLSAMQEAAGAIPVLDVKG